MGIKGQLLPIVCRIQLDLPRETKFLNPQYHNFGTINGLAYSTRE